MTTQDTHPITGLTDEALQALLKRAIRVTLVLGLSASLVLLLASGWRNAAMLATGAVISAASILEWQRLIRLFNAKLDQKKTPRGAATVVGFFLVRLVLFAAAIYGSLKCFQGSAIALLCGLGLAVIAMAWEALRLLKD
jgi:O-antigen/teichoic acid export membrane protein